MQRKDHAIFVGYASVFNNLDAKKHIVVNDAFAQQSFRSHLPILLQHKSNQLLGYVLNHKVDNHGLYIEAVMPLENQLQRRALQLIENNELTGMSVGMKLIDSYRRNGVLFINRVRLDEISLTPNPVNDLCRIESCVIFGKIDGG